jgi:predicted DNA-binding antitoxin AbrB/MazE fold protein
MSKTIEAVYENGVFRPVEPIKLEEGQRVQVYVPWVPDELTREQAEQSLRELQEAFSDLTDEEWEDLSKAWKRES